ncbi:MAG TPA: hypothetical protein VM820_07205 [Vicinamibacterales bacterium]|nr:hypothetical protein [Vicinamibacterales bacterium]
MKAAPACRRVGLAMGLTVILGVHASTAELKPATVAAFERYVRATEARVAGEVADERRFLYVDTLGETTRARLAELAAGRLVIERLRTLEKGEPIEAPDGLIHHWLGVVFVPGGTAAAAVDLLRDYDRHAAIYRPAIERSRLLEQSGDTYQIFLRFFMKKVIAVTVNSEHTARFTRIDSRRTYSRVVSTRVQEVEHPGTPSEQELPVGNDSGYLWRINSYWRFLERDGGVYLQCESISLTRAIPFGLGWAVGPFVTSIPRESLTFTLETTRSVLAKK